MLRGHQSNAGSAGSSTVQVPQGIEGVRRALGQQRTNMVFAGMKRDRSNTPVLDADIESVRQATMNEELEPLRYESSTSLSPARARIAPRAIYDSDSSQEPSQLQQAVDRFMTRDPSPSLAQTIFEMLDDTIDNRARQDALQTLARTPAGRRLVQLYDQQLDESESSEERAAVNEQNQDGDDPGESGELLVFEQGDAAAARRLAQLAQYEEDTYDGERTTRHTRNCSIKTSCSHTHWQMEVNVPGMYGVVRDPQFENKLARWPEPVGVEQNRLRRLNKLRAEIASTVPGTTTDELSDRQLPNKRILTFTSIRPCSEDDPFTGSVQQQVYKLVIGHTLSWMNDVFEMKFDPALNLITERDMRRFIKSEHGQLRQRLANYNIMDTESIVSLMNRDQDFLQSTEYQHTEPVSAEDAVKAHTPILGERTATRLVQRFRKACKLLRRNAFHSPEVGHWAQCDKTDQYYLVAQELVELDQFTHEHPHILPPFQMALACPVAEPADVFGMLYNVLTLKELAPEQEPVWQSCKNLTQEQMVAALDEPILFEDEQLIQDAMFACQAWVDTPGMEPRIMQMKALRNKLSSMLAAGGVEDAVTCASRDAWNQTRATTLEETDGVILLFMVGNNKKLYSELLPECMKDYLHFSITRTADEDTVMLPFAYQFVVDDEGTTSTHFLRGIPKEQQKDFQRYVNQNSFPTSAFYTIAMTQWDEQDELMQQMEGGTPEREEEFTYSLRRNTVQVPAIATTYVECDVSQLKTTFADIRASLLPSIAKEKQEIQTTLQQWAQRRSVDLAQWNSDIDIKVQVVSEKDGTQHGRFTPKIKMLHEKLLRLNYDMQELMFWFTSALFVWCWQAVPVGDVTPAPAQDPAMIANLTALTNAVRSDWHGELYRSAVDLVTPQVVIEEAVQQLSDPTREEIQAKISEGLFVPCPPVMDRWLKRVAYSKTNYTHGGVYEMTRSGPSTPWRAFAQHDYENIKTSLKNMVERKQLNYTSFKNVRRYRAVENSGVAPTNEDRWAQSVFGNLLNWPCQRICQAALTIKTPPCMKKLWGEQEMSDEERRKKTIDLYKFVWAHYTALWNSTDPAAAYALLFMRLRQNKKASSIVSELQ